MRIQLTILLLSANIALAKPVKQLSLLIPNTNFKAAILDNAIDNNHPDDVLLLEIEKDSVPVSKYKLCLYALSIPEFVYFSNEKKYYGYFDYKDHIVLVIGEKDPGYFFLKGDSQQKFDFLSYPPRNTKKDPPIAIEPLYYIFEYTNGQIKLMGLADY